MSANLVVDLPNTTDHHSVSIASISGQSTVVGTIVDLLHCNTLTNLYIGQAGGLSGILPIHVQTSDGLTSGSFTDPTSGLETLPAGVASGGIFWCNSGLYGSGNYSPSSPLNSAPLLCSGGIQFAKFQRPHRYARLMCTSGTAAVAAAAIVGGFIGQKRVTGSGGGSTMSPSSGTVNV